MKTAFKLAAASTAIAVIASTVVEGVDTLRFNGWYACGPTDSGYYGGDQSLRYECGQLEVPMCHEGICESKKTIDLFIKRLKATKEPHDTRNPKKSAWVLQGGPGASSSAMEDLMDTLHTEFNGELSVYTMDHRGTGRSFFLSCDAAQAYSNGSPGGADLTFDEYPACIQDILFKIENQTAAFSVTSAATDLVEAIDYLHKEHDVYVYGVSYGTYLVERLVHLAPPQVKGYILDGIESEEGGNFKERSGFSRPNEAAQEVAIRYFGYCEEDEICAFKLKTLPAPSGHANPKEGDLVGRVRALYERIDKNEDGCECASYFSSLSYNYKASYYLRMAFESSIMDHLLQRIVPAVFYRLNRCDEEGHGDLTFLKRYVALIDEFNAMHSIKKDSEIPRLAATEVDDISSFSLMLYNLIVYSELWEVPSRSVEDFHHSLKNSIIGSTTGESLVRDYCLFTGKTKEQDPVCDFDDLPESPAFVYPHDEHWNMTNHLPEGATALLLSGRLDILTANHFAVEEYGNIHGKHLLVEFDYAGHGAAWETPTVHDDLTCGVQILISYIFNDGQVDKVDTSCVDDVIKLEFQLSEQDAQFNLGVSEIYDANSNEYELEDNSNMKKHQAQTHFNQRFHPNVHKLHKLSKKPSRYSSSTKRHFPSYLYRHFHRRA